MGALTDSIFVVTRILNLALFNATCHLSHGQSGEDLCAGFHLIEGTGTCLNDRVTISYAIIGWDHFDVTGTLSYPSIRSTANFVFGSARVTGTVQSEGPFTLVTLGTSGPTIDVLGTVTALEVLLSANPTARPDFQNAARESGLRHNLEPDEINPRGRICCSSGATDCEIVCAFCMYYSMMN